MPQTWVVGRTSATARMLELDEGLSLPQPIAARRSVLLEAFGIRVDGHSLAADDSFSTYLRSWDCCFHCHMALLSFRVAASAGL